MPAKYYFKIISHKEHKTDFNNNGRLSPGDDVVQKYVFDKKTKKYVKGKWVFLDSVKRDQLIKILNDSKAAEIKSPIKQKQVRVVYNRTPPVAVAKDPPPLVIKDETSFGQHLKAGVGLGAGLEVGQLGVDAAVGFLGDLF